MSRRVCCLVTLVSVGVVLIIAGGVFIPVSKNIIHNEIKQQINLKSADTKKNWVKNPTPIYFEVYLWHLTNPDEVKNGTAKPSLAQKGPYVYRESREKVIFRWNDDNKTVTYKENRFFVFDMGKSVGPESDKFTTVNIPMMLIVNIVQKEFGLIQEAAEALLEWSKEDLFIELTVKDIIWGYVDPLLNKTVDLLHKFGIKKEIDDHFGIFAGTNGTDDGVYNIKTGEGDVDQFGIIKTWNYGSTLSYWTTDIANMLNGTDGTIFHPFVEKSDVMYVFSSDLCRSIYLTYQRDNSHMDIPTYRFVCPPEVFLNHTANPANAGFCTPTNSCLPSGLLDVENCRQGAPVVFSQPHFLNADPRVQMAVDGIHPDPEKHNTVIDIEPNTGAAFFAAKKLQVNIQLENVKHLTQTERIKPVVLPVMWINEYSAITDSLADEFKSKLQTPIKAIHIGIWVAIAVGIALVMFTVVYIVVRKLKHRGYEEMRDMTGDTTHTRVHVDYDVSPTPET